MYISIPQLREPSAEAVGAFSVRGVLYAKSSLKLIVNNRIGKVGIRPSADVPLTSLSVLGAHAYTTRGRENKWTGRKSAFRMCARPVPPRPSIRARGLPFFLLPFPRPRTLRLCEKRALYYTDVLAASGQRLVLLRINA